MRFTTRDLEEAHEMLRWLRTGHDIPPRHSRRLRVSPGAGGGGPDRGGFAAGYRAAYGELPSRTLRD